MQPQRQKFCGPYQQARQVRGRPMCDHTRLNCPYGLHACQLCGKAGHGAEDCRTHAAPRIVVPAPPPRPAGPTAIPTSKARGLSQPKVGDAIAPPPPPAVFLPLPPATPTPSTAPAPAVPTCSSVFVPGFGGQGEGTAANYGVAIAPPTLVADTDLPLALRQPGSASELHGGEAIPSEPLIPPPLPATTAIVENWISTCFRLLTDICTKIPPEIGESVLWRGARIGRLGQPSNQVEHRQGKVRQLEVDHSADLYLHLDCQASGEVRRVHIGDVECPSEPWLCADGGRCYREAMVRSNLMCMVKCPACTTRERWFSSKAAYRQHYQELHRSG